MGVLAVLQYGLSGLSVLLFMITVGILRAEQARKTIRPQLVATLRWIMAFAVIMMIIPAGLELFHQGHDATESALKASIREQVRSLSEIEDIKVMTVLGQAVPEGDGKQQLVRIVDKICNATAELQKTVAIQPSPDSCKDIDKALKNQRPQ